MMRPARFREGVILMTARPFRVLSLDGGGMRGTYTATYLASLAGTFARRRDVPAIDVGAAFDLIVGTSTGGIIACALAFGLSPADLVTFYKKHGPAIFPRRLPQHAGVDLCVDIFARKGSLQSGATALEAALQERFGDATLAEVYEQRRIALPGEQRSRSRKAGACSMDRGGGAQPPAGHPAYTRGRHPAGAGS